MSIDRKLVVDVNVVVLLALEVVGVHTGQRRILEALCGLLNRPVVIDGIDVTIRPVLTRHIVFTAETVLNRELANPETAAKALRFAVSRLTGKGGVYDSTEEDYKALSRRSWVRFGTDTEDEAIVAASERHHAAILTEDKDLRQYLGDRKIAHWSLTELVSAAAAAA